MIIKTNKILPKKEESKAPEVKKVAKKKIDVAEKAKRIFEEIEEEVKSSEE